MICNTRKVQCCITCKDEEKRDLNLDYGTYYYQDGGRRANVVEVVELIWREKLNKKHILHRQGIIILTMTTMTTQKVTCTLLSHITTLSITLIEQNILKEGFFSFNFLSILPFAMYDVRLSSQWNTLWFIKRDFDIWSSTTFEETNLTRFLDLLGLQVHRCTWRRSLDSGSQVKSNDIAKKNLACRPF